MTLLHGISVLDLIDELPPGSRGFVPADVAGFFEVLAIVEHRTLTSGEHYIHHGVIQSATEAGLSLPRGFPLEIPGLNTGIRFQFSSTRASAAAGQNLEPEPSGWQLDLFLDRLAIPIPGLKPAVRIESGPSSPAYLAPLPGGGDRVKFYGKGVLRIFSAGDGVEVRLIADPDPFTPDAPIGAVLELGLAPPHALFGDGSSGFGMTLGTVTVDASTDFTPTEIIARGHGPEWEGFGVSEAAIYLPRNLPGVGDFSLGVKDLLIGTSDPGGVQLEAWLEFGQSDDSVGNLQFFQDVGGQIHDLPAAGGVSNQRTITVHAQTEEVARVRARVNASPARNAQWKRPDDTTWQTGADTGWFQVRVGQQVLRFRDVTQREIDGQTRDVTGQEIIFSFRRSDDALPAQPPTIRVTIGGLSWDNVAHLGGSADNLGAPTFTAIAPTLTAEQREALTWSLEHAGAPISGRGESFSPTVSWQTGEHALILSDQQNRRRRINIQVLEDGLLIVGSGAGVEEVVAGVSGPATPTSVVATHTLSTFHAEGRLDSGGSPVATISGTTVTVAAGTLADVALERGGSEGPNEPTQPASPPVAHTRILMEYDGTEPWAWHEFHAQDIDASTRDPWGPEPIYPAHDNSRLAHSGDARQRLSRAGVQGAVTAWVSRTLAIDPSIRFVVVGHTCDIGSTNHNQALGRTRATAGEQILLAAGVPAAQLSARAEQDAGGPEPDPTGFSVPGRRLSDRTQTGWRIKELHAAAERSSWGETRSIPEREASRGVDIYALIPAANADQGDPSVDDSQGSNRRRALVPGADPTTTPAVAPAENNLNYRFEIRAKWDSPTWVDERDSIPVLIQLTFDWTPTDLPLPSTGGTDNGAIAPVNPTSGTSPDNYRIVARFTFDPRSGQAVFSASLDSPGDENGLLKFTSSGNDAGSIAGKMFATALALGPALLADVSTASEETNAVRISALLAAIVAATALDIVQEGTVVLHRVEIEHLQRDLGVFAGSRTRLLCDYVVELRCSAAMFGIESEDPIKLRYKNVGLELDDSKEGIEKFNVIFEEADFEVVNPGKWKINGWLGQLLGITAVRLGTGSLWLELDMELALDLGVVEISRATIRITIKDGGVTVDLRGLAASVNIPGTVKGAGALQVGGNGDVSASLDLTIIPADIRAYAALVMRDGMTHLEAGLRFATAIPLGGTGFGLFGFMGRFVSNGTRNLAGLSEDPVQREMAWYALPVVGSQSKYEKLDGQYAIGLGVVVGTMPDAGFTFNAEGMLTFEFPDPSVVLTIDASLMNPPSGEASETGGGGVSYSLSLLGVIAISSQGLAIGIAGKFEIPEVLIAKIPFAAWFPFQSGGPAGYLRVGSDGHRGRAGEPVSVKILPNIFDLKAWSFFMVEENELLELGKHPDFNFHGFSIGFGAGFSLKWGGSAIYLEVSASILAGFGTRPFTLMAGIFLKGELWLIIVGLGVSAELILRLTKDSWDLRGKVCAKISFFFFTIEGCVEFKIGSEPQPPPPPLPPLVTGVQLADKRARVLADAVDEAQSVSLTDANTAWPDATIVIHFSHTVTLALEPNSVQPTATTIGAGWVGTDRLKYLYVLESVELLDVSGNPVQLTNASGASIPANQWPSVWWMPAFRAALPQDGQPPAGDHEGWDLGVLKWDPAPWARAVPRGGEGLVSDPAEVLPRACDDPPAPSIHCVFGSNHQRTDVDRVTLRGPVTGELPYRSYFRVDAREGYGSLGIEMLSEYARLYGLALVPGDGVVLPELVDPVHGHGITGGWQLPYLAKEGTVAASLGFYADYVGDVVAPDLVLAVCIDIPAAEGEQQRCVGFRDFAPNRQLGGEVAVDQVLFRDRGHVLRTVDLLPINNPDGTSELNFTSKGLEIMLPVEASWALVEATWFHELGEKLELVAYNAQGVELGRTSGGSRAALSTLEIGATGIVRLILVGGNGTGVVTRVCYRSKQEFDGKAWAQKLFATMLGKQAQLHAAAPTTSILPLVRGVTLDGDREAWVPEPIDFAFGTRRACLFLRYRPEHDGPWAGFEILPFPRTKLIVVSTCAVSLDAWEAANADDELRENLQDEINDAAAGDQDNRVILLDANTTYRVRIIYKAAIWQRSNSSPTPPSPSSLNWSALPSSVTAHLNRVQTFRFRTAAAAELPDKALLAFERQDRFDPRALLRYLRGFDPDTASAHHLLDDLLWVHFDVEWIETLLARYGYAFELSVRRTDPPPQPEGAPPFPLEVALIQQWFGLPPVMLDLADQRVHEALDEASCVEPVPEGGSVGLRAELDPRAEYDIIVSAVHSNPDQTRYIKRGHFKTSRYRDVGGLLEAMGFPVTGRGELGGIEIPTGAEASPIFPFDFIAEAAPLTSVELGNDAALDAALTAIGMDPWPLPSGPATVLIWLRADDKWLLAAVLLDSDESMMRPPLPTELILPRLDGEDVSTPPPPPPLPPPRMEIEALQIAGVSAAQFTPRRSNASGTRVLLVADGPVDLGTAGGTAIAHLFVRDRVIDLGSATPTYRAIRLRAERFITRVPHIVYQEQA